MNANTNTVLKAVDGDFTFMEGSLRDKVYTKIHRARGHRMTVGALRAAFPKEPMLMNALRVLKLRDQVKEVKN